MNRQTAAGIMLIALVLLLAIAGNYVITYRLIQQRETVWCPLLATVTREPPHPTPAQARGFRELQAVRDGLGCR